MRVLDDLSLKWKLGLMPALSLLLLLACAALSWWGSAQLGAALQSLHRERLPSYAFAARLEADLRDLNGLVNQSLALEAAGFSAAEQAAVDGAIVTVGGRAGKALEERMAAAEGAERETLQALVAGLKEYRQTIADTVDMKTTGIATAATFLTTANTQYAALLKTVGALSARELQRAGTEVEQAQEEP